LDAAGGGRSGAPGSGAHSESNAMASAVMSAHAASFSAALKVLRRSAGAGPAATAASAASSAGVGELE
jgi:hypothetical protein